MLKKRSLIAVIMMLFSSIMLLACSATKDQRGEEDYEADKVADFYGIIFSVSPGRDGEKTHSSVDFNYYSRSFDSPEDTEEEITLDTLDEYCRNLFPKESLDSLWLTVNYMPQDLSIVRVSDQGKEDEVAYKVQREKAPEGEEGYRYSFVFDFTYGDDYNPSYLAEITYPEGKKVDLAFKVRNPEQKPLTEEAIAINLPLEEEEKKELYDYLINSTIYYNLLSEYLIGRYIHLEELPGGAAGEKLFSILLEDNGYLAQGYIYNNSIELIPGNLHQDPVTIDVDCDGEKETITFTTWGSGISYDYIYVFDSEEDEPIKALYESIWIRPREEQQGKAYEVIYQGDAPWSSGVSGENIGTIQVRTNAQGDREVYIEKASEDEYTDMEAHRRILP